MIKISISWYLYLELKVLGKWTHPLYSYCVPTVKKKTIDLQKKVNGFFHDLDFVKLIEQKHSHSFTLEFEVN